MKKNLILSVLMLSVLIVSLSVVSANGVITFTIESQGEIISPANGSYVSGDVLISWDNPEGIPGLYLQYKEGMCGSSGTWANLYWAQEPSELNYLWDTTELDDDNYCLRLQIDSMTYSLRDVFVDNTAPVVSFIVTTDSEDRVVFEPVDFDSTVIEIGSLPVVYDWDFGDGEIDATADPTHTYNEPGDYDVVLTVTDNAGNIGTFTLENLEILDIETENEGEPFEYEAGILEIAPQLDVGFDSGFSTVTCTVVPTSDEITHVLIADNAGNCTIFESPAIPYSERGVHEIIIKAESGGEIKYYDVTITVYSWWIELHGDDVDNGWNLISIPMMPEDTSIDSVLGGIQESIVNDGDYTIFQFDATYGSSGKWYKAKPTSTWTGTLDDIVPGYGYWIKMKNADTLKGYGNLRPGIGGAMLGVEVANGWNLIGHYGLNDLLPDNALTSLTIGLKTYWDAVEISTSGNMETGEGYWMTAKFLPEETALYTPSSDALNSVL